MKHSTSLGAVQSTGGEDTLHVGFRVWWDLSEWEGFVVEVSRLKLVAQGAAAGCVFLEWGGLHFEVRGLGRKVGEGPYFSWQLRVAGITWSVMNRRGPGPFGPNVLCEVGSAALMERGVDACYGAMVHGIETLGGRVESDTVSRVDLCVDLPGVPVSEFVQRFRWGRFLTRTRGRDEWTVFPADVHHVGLKCTGLTFGKGGPVVLRIYDKLSECARDERKLSILRARRWGGAPDVATRVEFQLRREVLKELLAVVGSGKGSFADYRLARAGIVAYLVKQWVSVAGHRVTIRNGSRQGLAPCWREVVRAFQSWAGESVGLTRVRRGPVDGSRLVRGALGCLVSAVCRVEDSGELFEWPALRAKFVELLDREGLKVEDLAGLQMDKWIRWSSKGPVAAPSVLDGSGVEGNCPF